MLTHDLLQDWKAATPTEASKATDLDSTTGPDLPHEVGGDERATAAR